MLRDSEIGLLCDPRSQEKLDDVAELLTRGIIYTAIGEETGLSLGQVKNRVTTSRLWLGEETGDPAWTNARKKTPVEAGVEFCRRRGLAFRDGAGS